MPASMAQRLARLDNDTRRQVLAHLSEQEADAILKSWRFWARADQLAPDGDWDTWLILAGRGWGKTRTGGEFVCERIEQHNDPTEPHRVALVGRAADDVRDVMIAGESGILAAARRRGWAADYKTATKLLTVTTPDGIVGHCYVYYATEPEKLRGPQFHTAWVDEAATKQFGRKDAEGGSALSNLAMGMRLGDHPRTVITTTPRPFPHVRELVQQAGVHITKGRTWDNSANLPAKFLEQLTGRYSGTRLARQELEAELLDDVEGALWTLALIDGQALTLEQVPDAFDDLVVSIDPPASTTGDETGLIVAGRIGDQCYILEDLSEGGLTPNERCEKAIRALHRWGGTTVVIETNNGGDWLPAAVKQTAARLARNEGLPPAVRVRTVTAQKSKKLRAEPVVALYEQGRVWHVRGADRHRLSPLEDQMTTWVPELTTKSPDRVDATVWAITHLAGLGGRRGTVRSWA